jgi:hypothetical protein
LLVPLLRLSPPGITATSCRFGELKIKTPGQNTVSNSKLSKREDLESSIFTLPLCKLRLVLGFEKKIEFGPLKCRSEMKAAGLEKRAEASDEGKCLKLRAEAAWRAEACLKYKGWEMRAMTTRKMEAAPERGG